jgi:DNA-binding MarR family transcriptional regulator
MAHDAHILELVERIGGLIRAAVRECAAGHGLQPVHVEILDYLARCNRFSDTPQAIAAYLGLTKGTVSQSVGRLEERGLVSKAVDGRDRRRLHVRPTAKGREVVRACRLPAAMHRAAERLDDALAVSTGKGLTRLLQEIQLATGNRTFGQCRGCRHLLSEGESYRCGLTGEPLSAQDTGRICYEHTPADTRAVGLD